MLCVCVYTYLYEEREIYYKILAHAIMAVEKSHCLPSTSWRSRKAVMSFRDLRVGELVVQTSIWAWTSEIKGKRSVLQPKQSSPVNSIFFHIFVLSRLTIDWMMPAYIGEGFLLYLVHHQLLMSCKNTLTDTPRNSV